MTGGCDKISDCELCVLMCIWNSKKKLSLSDIVKILRDDYDKEWAPQTVSTFLKRLQDKGILKSERKGRAFLYEPLISKEEYKIAELLNIRETLFKGKTSEMIKSLMDSDNLSKTDIKAINKLLNK